MYVCATDAANLFKGGEDDQKITPEGTLHTFAGTHTPGFNGSGPAPATTLQIENPNGLFVLPNGTVYLLLSKNGKYKELRESDLMKEAATILKDSSLRLVKGQYLVPQITFKPFDE